MDITTIGLKIFSLLKNNFPGYATSIAASITYDAAKSTDFDILWSRLIEMVFSEFCPYVRCQFNATVTVNSFYDALSKAREATIQDDYILKEVICETLDTELTIEQYGHWIETFCRVCTNPEYQWIMNYIDHDKKSYQSKNYILENIRAKLLYLIGNNVEKDFGPVSAMDEIICNLDNVFQTSAWKDDLLKLLRSALPDSRDKRFFSRLKYLESTQPYDLIQSSATAMYKDYRWERKQEKELREMLRHPHYDRVFFAVGTEGTGKSYFVCRYLHKSVDLISCGQLHTIPIFLDVQELLSGKNFEDVLVTYLNTYLSSEHSSLKEACKMLKLYNWSVCYLIDDVHCLGLKNPEKFFKFIEFIKDSSMYREIFWFLTFNTHESYMLARHKPFLERYLISSQRLQIKIPEKNLLLSETVFPLENYNQAYHIPQIILQKKYGITLKSLAFNDPALHGASDTVVISPYEAHILGQSVESGTVIEFPNTYLDFVNAIYKLKNQQIYSKDSAESQRVIADISKIAHYVLDQMKTSFENEDIPHTPVDALHEDLRLLQLLSLVPYTSEQIDILALHSFAIENKIFWSKHLLLLAKSRGQLTVSKLARMPDSLQVWMMPCFLLDVCTEQNCEAIIDELFRNHAGHFALFCTKRLDTQFERILHHFLLGNTAKISNQKLCFAAIYFLYHSKIRIEEKLTLCKWISGKVVAYGLLSIYESAFRHIIDGFTTSRSLRRAAVQLSDCTDSEVNFIHGFICGNKYYSLQANEQKQHKLTIEGSVQGLVEFILSKPEAYESIRNGDNCSFFDHFIRALIDQYIAGRATELFASYESLLPLFTRRDREVRNFVRRNYTNAVGNYYSRHGKYTEYRGKYISLINHLISTRNELFAFFLILNSQNDNPLEFEPDAQLKKILSNLLKNPSIPEKYKNDPRIKLWFPLNG